MALEIPHTTEKFHISTQYKNIIPVKKQQINNQLNDQNTLEQNTIYRSLFQVDN